MVNGRVPLVQVLVGEGLGVVVEEVDSVGVAGVVEEEVLISEQFTAPTPQVYFPSGHERHTSMSSS